MTNRIADISQRKAAIIAGIGLLTSFIPAIFANYFVLSRLIVPGDATTTANNILANEGLFRAGIVSWFIVLTGDVVRAWAFYVFFKQVNKSLALLAGWFMLIHVAIFGITQLNLVFASGLLSGAGYLTVFEPNQLHSLALLFLNGHNYGFQIGLFFFSIHLFFLGYLVFKSGYIPRILGVLLIIASFSYLIDSVGQFLLPNYPEIITMVLAAPMFIGETAFVVWLVFKGGKIPEIKS
ncbi:MAG: DUF4386 domain-containing protein [Planctomycetota bacterium]|jgi:hypothetical protein